VNRWVGGGERAEGLALESNLKGDLADAGGGAGRDALDGFCSLAVLGVVEGAFFLDVLRSVLAAVSQFQ